jgi:uncharacterized membrane protein (DUF4010 family)
MEMQEFYSRFFVALIIGLLLGIERGWKQRSEASGEREAGIRTFTLVSLTGFAAGMLAEELGPVFPSIIGAGLLGLVVASYFSATARANADRGMTTEVAVMLTYVLGVVCANGLLSEAAVIAVIAVVLLDQKSVLHDFLRSLQHVEIIAALKLLVVAVVLLPILPDQGFGPGGVLNPYELCWAVVVIAAMGLAGYAAIRAVGSERGALLMGLFGGFVSSTSVTVSASRAARTAPAASLALASAISVAQSVMFARIAALVYTLNPALFDVVLLPLVLGCIVSLVGTAVLVQRARSSEPQASFDAGAADSLGIAVRFIAFVAIMLVVAHYANAYAGSIGLILSSLIAGAVDVDAATVSASRLASASVTSTTSLSTAAITIAVAVLANSLVKSVIAFRLGTPNLGWPAASVLIASGVVAMVSAFAQG